MKILFLITRADTVGGAQAHVKDLAISLQQDQHQVLIITGILGIYNDVLKQQGINSIACETLKPQIDPIQDGKSLKFILNTIRDFQPDLLAIHSSKTGILGRIASKISKIPCTFTAHGWSFTTGVPEPNRSIYKLLEKLVAPLTNKIICVSQCDRKIAIKAGINPDRLITIHNGMKDIEPTLKANPDSDRPLKILMVARFDRQKDHKTLIEAFQDISGAELILVGDGSSFDEMQDLVKKLNLSDRVQFLGFREDVAEIIAQSHIFVLISNWEGLPCTIIEAMRANLPVIASAVGGISELIENGKTGYLIPHGDRVFFKQKLVELLDNPELRVKMGQAGRQKYESQFKFEYMYQKTLSTYGEVVSFNKHR